MSNRNKQILEEITELIGNFIKPVLSESKSLKSFPAFLDLRLDAKFISREEDIDDKDYRQVISAARSIGIDKSKSLQDSIISFIGMAKDIQSVDVSASSVSDLMNQVRVMRLLYNLVDNASPSSAGILFERLFAILFGMKVEIGTKDNIEDVVGPSGKGVSLKLIGPNTAIEGSKKLLSDSGGTVDYIVARKETDKSLSFYKIVIELLDNSEKSLKQKFKVSYFKAAKEGKPLKKDGVLLRAEKIGTMDISGIIPVSQRIAESVNSRFESLLSETENLIDAVRDLVGAKDDVKSKAKSTERKAEKTRASAEKISKK